MNQRALLNSSRIVQTQRCELRDTVAILAAVVQIMGVKGCWTCRGKTY